MYRVFAQKKVFAFGASFLIEEKGDFMVGGWGAFGASFLIERRENL